MASHGGDDGGRWGPSTQRVGGAGLEDDETVTRSPVAVASHDDGATTHRNWAPGGEGDGPATVPHTRPGDVPGAGPASISDAETVMVHHGSTLVSEDATQDESWAPPPAFGAPPPPHVQVETSSRRGVPLALVVVVILIVGSAAFAAGWLFKPSAVAEATAAPEPSEDEGLTAAGAASSEPVPSSEPVVEAVATAAASAPPTSPEAPSPAEVDELLSYEGFLTVDSSADAEVYVQGKHIGRTNERLRSRCYQRFVRLKDATSGRWLTPGRPVRIACMSSTTVEIEPER